MLLDRKIAFINLTTQKITVKPIPVALRRKFLGGRGMNMFLLSRHYTPSLDPFSPENPLIFGAGLLTGCLSFGSRISITSKSPESGHLGDSNMGGDFGAELIKAGFSHVVISGKSSKPVYLLITDNQIKVCDAKKLIGLDTLETQKKLRSALKDDKVQIACIGLAGENLVRFAAIRSGRKSSAGRTGMGAVMGSKNVKALAVRGTQDIKVSDPQKYLSYYRATLKNLAGTKWAQALGKYGTPLLFGRANALGILSVRNNQSTSVGDQGYRLAAEALEPYSTGMVACFSCPVHCRHRFVIEKGDYQGTQGEGPEYASLGSLGTKLGNLDLENSMYAIELCNRYGLDTISTGSYIAWAMELYQRGIINQKVTKRPLVWGDRETITELIHQVAHRKDFGNILAEGPFAQKVLGPVSKNYLLEIKNFPIEMTDERLPKSFALGMATASRGACHMRSRASIDVLGLPEGVLHKLYGGPISNDLASYVGKGRMVWWHEVLNAVSDSLGICRFLTVFSSPHALQYQEFSRLITLATGLDLSAKTLKQIGERICTLEKMMLVKDGIAREHDTLPKRYFDEPIPDGPARGAFISRPEFDQMLDDYYRLHGWGKNGIPKKNTLKRLGIEI